MSAKMKSGIHSRRGQRGAALIEALVTLLLFIVGILGVVAMHGSMTRVQTDAKFRADAANLSAEVTGLMWVDRGNLAQYATSPSSACTSTRCADWIGKVAATLPNGKASVEVAGSSVNLTITWSISDGLTRTYAAATAIQ